MNVIQRAVVQQLLGHRFGVDRCQHFQMANITFQFYSTHVHRSKALKTKQLENRKAFSTGGIFAASSKSYDTSPSLIYRLRNMFGIVPLERHKLSAKSFQLYNETIKNIKHKEFITKFGLANTFNSWFVVTELHIWMLSVRAMAEGPGAEEDGRFMRNEYIKLMWNEVQIRINKMDDVRSDTTRRQTRELSLQFQFALTAYDEGLLSDDIVLANALWQRVLNSDCDDITKIDALVHYVRKTIYNLDQMDKDEFCTNPNTKWMVPLKELYVD